MKQLRFTVPWSALCSDNRKFVSGAFVLTAQYRASKAEIGRLAKEAAKKQKWARSEGLVRLDVVLTVPNKRGSDLYNFAKNLQDGITESEAVWWDDVQVRCGFWERMDKPDKDRAGAIITITEAE